MELTKQTLSLMKAETEIRRAVKDAFTRQASKTSLTREVKDIIRRALKGVTIRRLKIAAFYSLWQFYDRQWSEISRLQAAKAITWACLLTLTGKSGTEQKTGVSKEQARRVLKAEGYSVTPALINGVPMRMYAKKYFEEYVKPTFERLLSDEPKDPHDISGRNSLRNRAEMEVRYQGHLDQISDLKRSGHKLVIASTHSDCSDRCRPWQGRVYSLDGTSGKTDDGRQYVPLEQATDVFYTTKAGITYKNGLLGFNCRHYLIPYQNGLQFQKWARGVEQREYGITKKQRYMERVIRKWKYRAEMYRGQDDDLYKEAKRKAAFYELQYREFCRKNHRAEEKTRTTIL